jgi:Fuc2NAc and GlcNAc transferase
MTPDELRWAVWAGVTSCFGTYLFSRSSIGVRLLDVPNTRSSHTTPVPRIGGVAMAIAMLTAFAGAAVFGALPPQLTIALVGGAAVVALIGILDDARGVSPAIRLAVHIAVAVWTVAWIAGMNTGLPFPDSVTLHPVRALILVLGITAAINFYNFMDGIDGIAGAQAVSVGLVAFALFSYKDLHALTIIPLVTAVAAAGFLVWNWSPASIFLGDCGSGMLGYVFSVMVIASSRGGGVSLIQWSLLLGVFAFDATVTLVRRLLHGDPVWIAHRRHAYQRAVQAGFGHAAVSTAVIMLNVVLAALALAAETSRALGIACAVVGVMLLTAVYLYVERLQPMYPEDEPLRSA